MPGRSTENSFRVGLVLTHQYGTGSDLFAAVAEQRETLRFIRDRGWDPVMVGQHFLAESLVTLQPLPLLAHAAADSGDMQVCVGIVLLSLVNPVEAAENYATLDALCGGWLVFGVGLAYRDVEYAAFGVDPSEKVRRFVANLDIIRRLWSDESVNATCLGVSYGRPSSPCCPSSAQAPRSGRRRTVMPRSAGRPGWRTPGICRPTPPRSRLSASSRCCAPSGSGSAFPCLRSCRFAGRFIAPPPGLRPWRRRSPIWARNTGPTASGGRIASCRRGIRVVRATSRGIGG
jgi:hypothetical protein